VARHQAILDLRRPQVDADQVRDLLPPSTPYLMGHVLYLVIETAIFFLMDHDHLQRKHAF
jgi:hypothetical protein